MRQGEAELWRLIAPWMDKQSYLAVRATSATALQDLPRSYYLARLHLRVESFSGSVSCIDAAGKASKALCEFIRQSSCSAGLILD